VGGSSWCAVPRLQTNVARRTIKRQVTEPDLDERIEGCAAAPSAGGPTGRFVDTFHPFGRGSLICIAHVVGDIHPLDLR